MLKKLAEAWKSYFKLRARWAAGELEDKPGLPRYRKNKDGSKPFGFIPVKDGRSYAVSSTAVELSLPKDLRSAGRLSIAYRGKRRYVGKARRAEAIYDHARDRWHFVWSVDWRDGPPRERLRAGGIDLGIRVLASLSIEGDAEALHFSGREVLKDFDYWGRRIAHCQQVLATRGLKASKTLARLHARRRARLVHAWEAIAERIAEHAQRMKLGTVYIGWPKDIRRERT